MNKIIVAALALLTSTAVLADTQHYLRRDGNHVQHLKITRIGDDVDASMDVNFEANGSAEEGKKPCVAEVSGDAKTTGANEITLRKQIEGEARHCQLNITFTGDGAKVEQSPECGYYLGGSICHFDSEGKELTRVK